MAREPDAHETLNYSEFVARQATKPATDHAVLVLPAADGREQIFPITRNPTVIGRSVNADLVLPDAAVSDFHARIIRHSFGYTVEDLGSAEGTFVCDRRVNHARLVDGDELRLGATQLTFVNEHQVPDKERPAPTRALVAFQTPRAMVARQTVLRDRYAGDIGQHFPAAPPARRSSLPDDSGPSFDEILIKAIRAARYLREHARLIASFALLGLGMAAISFKLMPPVRAAYSVVMLHPAPMVNPMEPDATRQSQPDQMQFFVGVDRAFTSTDAVLASLRRMGVPAPTDAQAEALAKRLHFESIGNNMYTASFTPSVFSARNDWHLRFLDTHIKSYVEHEVEKKLKVFVAEADFLRSETQEAEKRLGEIMQQTVQYREAHADQILAQGTLAKGSPADLETNRIEVLGRISRLEGELAGVRSQLGRGSALSQAKSQATQADRDAIAAVNRKLAELRAQGFADGHPDIQRLLEEQANLQRMVEQRLHADVTQFERRSNVAYDALQGQADQVSAQLKAARAERATIEASLRDLRTVNAESAKVNARIDELARMADEAKRQQAVLFDRLQKAEVQLQLERVSTSSRYEIVVPARLETAPGKRALVLRLALGLMLGLLTVAGVLGIGELRRIIRRVTAQVALGLVLMLLVTFGPGCVREGQFIWAEDLPVPSPAAEPVISPRDTILVEVDRQPTLSGEFVVRDDGHYTQPMVGSIAVSGQTTRQVANAVASRLHSVVVSPLVSVWITKVHPVRVSVVGEVKTPGTYELVRDRNLLAALASAGWLTEFAHDDRIYVLRPSTTERIRFRLRDITTASPHAAQFQLSDTDVVDVE
ncbi:MAG: FHA domain-containing protein [Polyangia bacterium]